MKTRVYQRKTIGLVASIAIGFSVSILGEQPPAPPASVARQAAGTAPAPTPAQTSGAAPQGQPPSTAGQGRGGGRGRSNQPAPDPSVPQPLLVTAARLQGQPPSDAFVLFDGTTLDQWTAQDGSAAKCRVDNGAILCVTGDGNIRSKATFTSVQLHLEYSLPDMPAMRSDGTPSAQHKANSGVFLHGRHEIQILDSYLNLNRTYPDGVAGSLYRVAPPLVNVSRAPGEWQVYDMFLYAPKCEGEGTLVSPGSVTVLHNGVLIQDRVALRAQPNLCTGGVKELGGPLQLQDHGGPRTEMRFRNIWFRAIPNK